MKNSDDTIGDRTRDLPACSTVPPEERCREWNRQYGGTHDSAARGTYPASLNSLHLFYTGTACSINSVLPPLLQLSPPKLRRYSIGGSRGRDPSILKLGD